MTDLLHKIRAITAREIVGALQRDGFQLVRHKGSHHRYTHQDGRRVTVSFSAPSDTFLRKTLRSMVEKQARWKDEDLERLKLV